MNILLTIVSGAASIGVFLLIGIAKDVKGIGRVVAALGVKIEYQEKQIEKHDQKISDLQYKLLKR